MKNSTRLSKLNEIQARKAWLDFMRQGTWTECKTSLQKRIFCNNIEVRETSKQPLLDEMTNLYLFVLIDFQYFIFWFVTLSQIIYVYFTI